MDFLQTLQNSALALVPTFVAVIAVALVLKVRFEVLKHTMNNLRKLRLGTT